MKIVVVGLGKLGAPISGVMAQRGHDVVGLDLDQLKVDAINEGRAPVQEPGLEWLIASCGSRLRATTKAEEAIPGSDACIFITPTPSLPDGSFDNAPLLKAIESVAKQGYVNNVNPYLFIIASTVTPGTCDDTILPLISKLYPYKFHLVYKPEFIALGSVIRDLQKPDFHLIGQSSAAAGELAAKIYGPFRTWSKRMSLIEAELAKISLNCFVTMKISFANQIGMVAQKLGADPHKILDAIGNDHRIGRAALKPGLPYSGTCFPRDSRMFSYVANSVNIKAHLAIATDAINDQVVESIALAAIKHRGDIGILGTAYKPGTSITEESAGTRIRDLIIKWNEGANQWTVKTHDPMAPHSHHIGEVLACPILIVATPWPEYECIPFREGQIVIDPMQIVKSRVVKLEKKDGPACH